MDSLVFNCDRLVSAFLVPIISLLVQQIFVYLEFDASTKLKELEIHIIPALKQMLGAVEEQKVLRSAEDKGAEGDLKTLDSMKMHLKSALYEAEDILDLLDYYHRIEKDLHHVDNDSIWVENQLAAACTWIARCKGSWFGQCIDSIIPAVMKSAQSMTRQGQFLIQGWRHSRQNSHQFSICRAINIAGAAVLHCAKSLYIQLGQLLRSLVLSPETRGSESVPADPAHSSTEVMVDEEEIVQETRVDEEEGDKIQDGEEGAMSEREEVGQTLEEESKEETCSSILRYCARSMLTWFAKACFYRDLLCGIIGITSDKVPYHLTIISDCDNEIPL